MRRLRRSILLRLCTVGLLLSLGTGLAAPVAAAGWDDGAVQRLGLGDVPRATLDAALAIAAGAETPEDFAEALSAALRHRLGAAAPSADALLGALYGQLFRVLQEEVGDRAVVHAAGPGGAVQAPLKGEVPPGTTPAPGHGAVDAEPVRQAPLPAPRALRPSVQPLGP